MLTAAEAQQAQAVDVLFLISQPLCMNEQQPEDLRFLAIDIYCTLFLDRTSANSPNICLFSTILHYFLAAQICLSLNHSRAILVHFVILTSAACIDSLTQYFFHFARYTLYLFTYQY